MWYLIADRADRALKIAAHAYGETLIMQPMLPCDAELVFLRGDALPRPSFPCICIAIDRKEPAEIGGWDFAVREPFDREMLVRIARGLCNRTGGSERRAFCESCLDALSVPRHLLGYRYLSAAVERIRTDAQPMQVSILHEVYPFVAHRYGTSAVMVNRAIRHAVDLAWRRGSVEAQRSYFGYASVDKKGVPTNTEFLFAVCERLRLLLDAEVCEAAQNLVLERASSATR